MTDVSIVFRNKDGTHTGKIYVNDYQAAAELASKFRHASHIVDVISIRDEVILRWHDGHPDWKYGQIKPIKLTAEAYRFERSEDQFWDVQNRLWLLTDALCAAFEIVTGQTSAQHFAPSADHVHDFGGEDVWPLLDESQTKAGEIANEPDNEVWEAAISDWMSNSKHLFIHHQIEHAALTMHTQEFSSSKRVRYFGIELADLTARR